MPKKKKRGFANPSPDKVYGEPIVIKIQGEEWKLNRVTVRDTSAIYGRIRDNRIMAVLRNIRAVPPHIAAEAIAYTGCLDPTQEDFENYVSTPAGAVYFVWRCLQGNHPQITEEKVAELIEAEGGLIDILFAESGLRNPSAPINSDQGDENSPPLQTFRGGSPKEEAGSKGRPE